ncbi:MAG: aminoacetone oxidase family FAD-binding enzyme [Lachnospiraceae bacterium]|nr:aminoacetone oxidase family FAD-binding enzyme [Lachnospiraceae bacterium]
MNRSITVIGAGPAGMTAAIRAAGAGGRVLLLEHNDRVGKKLLSTGNGKCNITNEHMAPSCFHSSCPEFVEAALSLFGKDDALAFMNEIGVWTRLRQGGYYPRSAQAPAVLDALRFHCDALGIRTLTRTEATDICPARTDGGFTVRTNHPERGRETFFSQRVILAAGSKAAPKTGSDGSGYRLAGKLGHRILTPLPALVQLKSLPAVFKPLAGLRVDVRAALFCRGTRVLEEQGELQCVDYGLSGIPIFQLSGPAIRLLEAGEKPEIALDFVPELDEEIFCSVLLGRREALSYLDCENFLTGFFPKPLAGSFLRAARIPLRRSCLEPEESDWRRLCRAAKEFRVPILGYNSFDRAQTCSGGADPSEVDCKTMESKRIPGLYFAGEILDVDGICGGYNLQWAWTSGSLAGSAAAGKGGPL